MSNTRNRWIRGIRPAFIVAALATACSDGGPPSAPPAALGTAAEASRCEVPYGRRSAGGPGALDFATNRLFTTGSDPFSVAIADFDRDGHEDLAVANNGDDTVAVLLGNGDGSFQPARAFGLPSGAQPFAVAVGDFNHDRNPDIAVTDNGTGKVTVLFGDGHGGFAPEKSFPAVASPGPIAVSDVDHDGNLDIVVLSTSTAPGSTLGQGCVLLGDGHGHFQAPRTFSAPAQPSFFPLTGSGTFAVGDFNGDGTPDLAVADSANDQVDLIAGDGHGGFQLSQSFSVGASPSSVAAGDFNGDARLDLAVTNEGDASVSVLLGNGKGGFGLGSTPTLGGPLGGTSPLVLAVGDFDGDHQLDIAVEMLFSTEDTDFRNLGVLLGNGDGTFQAPQYYVATWAPNAIAVGKLDGDDRLDIVATDAYVDAARVLLGNGDGTFRDALQTFTGTQAYSVVAGDFNHDCKPDLAVMDNNSDVVSILLGQGDGTFELAQTIAVPFGQGLAGLAVGDLNHDGHLDLVATSSGVTVLLGNGHGTFSQISPPFLPNSNPNAVVIADFNDDHNLDIAAVGSEVTVLLGNGSRTHLDFAQAPPGTANATGTAAVAGDFNGDGEPDLAVVAGSIFLLGPGDVTVLLGNGAGGFSSAQTFATGPVATSVATADLDGDGVLNLAVADFGSDDVSVLVGKGDGTFRKAVSFDAGTAPTNVAIADFDGDGRLDLAVTHAFESTPFVQQTEVDVLLGSGHGRHVDFQPRQRFGVGLESIGLAVADFDVDGRPDIAATCVPPFFGIPESGVNVILNRTR